MNIEWILGEIDAEIEKLLRIRAILEELSSPKLRMVARRRPVRVERLPEVAEQPEPRLVVLPPKPRREYTRRVKPAPVEPKALAAPLSSLPVFVPKAAVREAPPAKEPGDGVGLETVIRRKLLGGVA